MEMRNFRPELHVAQQSRRDKLRVPQSSSPAPQLEDFPDHLEQLVVHQRLNPDLVQVRSVSSANLLYDPAAYSSEIINFSTKSNVLSAERDGMLRQEVDATQIARHIVGEDSPFANSSLQVSPNINSLSKAPIEPQNCGNWKGFGSHQSFDWMMSHASGSVGDESNISSPMFLGEVSNISAYPQFLKPGYIGFQDVRSLKNHSCEISSEDRQKRSREMHFTPSSLYQNTFQDVFASASIRTQGLEMVSHVQQNFRGAGRGAWADGGNELGLLPAYGNQSDVICFDNGSAWTNRPVESCHQWNGELGCVAGKSGENLRNDACDSNPQGLSLSLSSSKPTLKVPAVPFGDRCGTEDLQSRTTALNDPQDSKSTKSGYLSSVGKPSTISRCGKSLQDMVGVSTNTYRSTGPLGPFTGYATILKSSKFLKPTQQLLDECCGVSGSKVGKTCEVSERRSGEVSALGDTTNEIETEAGVIGNNSGASSSTFYSSNEMSCDGGVGSSSSESFRPEFQQRKAKLLYMQEEVCRRYKQYHQQMQMVVSSFESVAGLSSATPYISLALKSVSRHFRFLKNAISDQLKHIGRALGEDLSSPTTGISSSKGDTNLPRLKHLEQSLPRQRYGAGNVSFFETQQPVWRPQRGLPERSVAILRAWLFEHFLHPYPTDTDKHMLATQTGLSRNQVSNWFINARVRVWKPMVEEIHMLETKGVAGGNPSSNRNDEGSTAEGNGHPGGEQLSHNLSINMMPNKRLERTGLGSPGSIGHGIGVEQWDQEKRSRMDCQIPAGMDGSLMGFVPYQRRGLEMGGLGAVSLTLGLRHGAENVQHQQQEDQLRQQFGGRMIHDFVG